VELDGSPLKLSFTRESDGLVLQSAVPLRILVKDDGTILQYKLGFESPSDEAFYGFGERFNALNQRGNRLDNYVYGQYTGQGKRSYIPMPFFISSRAYGVWLQTERQADFDLAAEESHCWSLAGRVEEENAGLQIKFFFQPHPREIVKAFTRLTGKPKVPAAWVFGPWMSSNDWNSQAEVLRQLQLTQSYQIPATVLVIEAWSDEVNFYIWNDAQYQQKPSSQGYQLKDFTFPPDGRWTDPKAMADVLHQAGVRLVLWQNPTIKQCKPGENLDETLNKADQAYAIEQGLVVHKADGSPHRVEAHMPWFGSSLVVDFTNPEAVEWWCKKREYLVSEVGVDGFKTDGGEHIWDPETRFYNGLRGVRGINNYPLDYERAYQHFMQTHRGEDFVLFSRAGYTGAQQIPCHWAGDENSTWDAYRATLRAMFNIGLCGVPFFGWDIAGFAGPIPSSELYLRATAFSAFCPIMQYHSDVNHRRKPSRDRTPWNIQEQTGNPEVISTFRKFANLRMNLFPYILSQADESSQSGLPLVRTLVLEYPQDAAVRDFPYEYMFGDALLVAPVVEEGVDAWPVYLPEGEWRELWSGEIQHGPAVVKMNVPFDRIPVFQKQGSVLPLHLDASGELCSPVGNSIEPAEHLTLQVFPVEKTALPISLSIEAVSDRVVSIIHEEEVGMHVQVPAATQSLEVRICGSEPNSVSIDAKSLPRLAEGAFPGAVSGWQWDPQKQETRIYLSRISSAVRIQVQ
jgi:alpha-glucosidase (family GH31 glycosyl hydrolase)